MPYYNGLLPSKMTKKCLNFLCVEYSLKFPRANLTSSEYLSIPCIVLVQHNEYGKPYCQIPYCMHYRSVYLTYIPVVENQLTSLWEQKLWL